MLEVIDSTDLEGAAKFDITAWLAKVGIEMDHDKLPL